MWSCSVELEKQDVPAKLHKNSKLSYDEKNSLLNPTFPPRLEEALLAKVHFAFCRMEVELAQLTGEDGITIADLGEAESNDDDCPRESPV